MRDATPPAAERKGSLVISLDFELHWGVRDLFPLPEYRANLEGERAVVPALLDLFAGYGVHATWATVGLLFFDNREQLLAGLPRRKPEYANSKFSPYPALAELGVDEGTDPLHFAASLLRQIARHPGQEIATHTFSHYYCLEPGQDVEAFREDLEAARRAAARLGLILESLVFPRNQFNRSYLEVCRQAGIKAYRGNESSWLYRARSLEEESLVRRGLRFLDSYVSLSSHNCYALEEVEHDSPCNLPSSRFLRPYSPWLRPWEFLRMERIVSDLTYAARHGLVYHLWWHPHNFGRHTRRNLAFLEKVLREFAQLREEYGMESLNMGEAAARVATAEAVVER